MSHPVPVQVVPLPDDAPDCPPVGAVVENALCRGTVLTNPYRGLNGDWYVQVSQAGRATKSLMVSSLREVPDTKTINVEVTGEPEAVDIIANALRRRRSVDGNVKYKVTEVS